MLKTRKAVMNFLTSVKNNKGQYTSMEEDIVLLSSQADYNRSLGGSRDTRKIATLGLGPALER